MSYTRLWVTFQPKLLHPAFAGLLSRAKILPIVALLLAIFYPTIPINAATNGNKADFTAMPASPMTAEVSDDQGLMTALDQFKGVPILVNFWATWCAPCVAELPALERAAIALAGDNMKVVVISIDRGGLVKAGPFLDKYAVSTPTRLFDPKARLSREMGVRGLPTSFIISADQKTSWMFVGPFEWDDQEFLDQITGLPLGN